jgi:6-phospho-beta-glucosidase
MYKNSFPQGFKDGFLWGGATAANQLEGGWNLDHKGLTTAEVVERATDRKNFTFDKVTKESLEKALHDPSDTHYPKRRGVDFYHHHQADGRNGL